MKKISFILVLIVFIACGDNGQVNNCFPNFTFNEVVNLNNPQFVDLQVPGGDVTVSISGRNLLIFRRNNTSFKAFDLQCPELDCSSVMTFDGLKLKCPCSNKEYNSLNGSPIDGEGCFALEYIARSVGNNTLQITR